MSWPWISARRLTSWHIKGCYPSCRRIEFEASCILEWLVFLQITNNVLSSVVNHHNGFQCHQVCHKVQCWAHCCSWYKSTTSQKISHPISDYLLMTVCCTAPLNHCKTANFSNRMLIDFYNGRKNGWWNSTSRSVPTWVFTNCSQDFKTSHIKWITMHYTDWWAKYLGVMLTSDLKWNTHISNTTANRSLGLVKRSLHAESLAYASLVRSHLEYVSSAWDSYTESNKHKLESVQHIAARFVVRNYDCSKLGKAIIQKLGWKKFEQRRKEHSLKLMFKVESGQSGLKMSKYFEQKIVRITHQCRHNKCYVPP